MCCRPVLLGGIMKTVVKKAIRDEKGAAFALALVLLVVGGLILTPLLGLMSTGLIAGQVYEKKTHEYYAADAGVEDAIWKILYEPPEWKPIDDLPDSYMYEYPEALIVGGKTVHVVMYAYDWDPTCAEDLTYQIVSTIVSDDGGGVASINSTAIDAYLSVSYLSLSWLLDNAIVSDNSITIDNGMLVTGNVTSGGTVDNKGTVNGTIRSYADLDWPAAEDLSAYYLDQVNDAERYERDTLLDLEGNGAPPGPIYKTIDKIREAVDWPDGLGPLYVDGTLHITSSDPNQDVTLRLNDTLYITGNTQIHGPTNNDPSELTIDLNGQTIFVASPSSKSRTPPDAQPALSIEKCNIIGSGCIIALGDVYFSPKGDVGSEEDFVLVMSVQGATTLQPSGTFYGCIAGNLLVDVQSGTNATITHTDPEAVELNIPWGARDMNDLPPIIRARIESWDINPP